MSKTLTLKELIKAIVDGRKVRDKGWREGTWVSCPGHLVFSQDDRSVGYEVPLESLLQEAWELYQPNLTAIEGRAGTPEVLKLSNGYRVVQESGNGRIFGGLHTAEEDAIADWEDLAKMLNEGKTCETRPREARTCDVPATETETGEVDLHNLEVGDQVRLYSGKVKTVSEICDTDSPQPGVGYTDGDFWFYRWDGTWNSMKDAEDAIVEIIKKPKADLCDLEVGDSVCIDGRGPFKVEEIFKTDTWDGLKKVTYSAGSWNFFLDGSRCGCHDGHITKIVKGAKTDIMDKVRKGSRVKFSNGSSRKVVKVDRSCGSIKVHLWGMGIYKYNLDGTTNADGLNIVEVL